MDNQAEPKILIFYSNPIDTYRIRLDKEHRAIDQLLQRQSQYARSIHRLHATSPEDLSHILRAGKYEIVQFSGHGSADGIFLEDIHANKSSVITAQQISAILTDTCPQLKAAIFLSCYSALAIPDLVNVAPYLITVSEEADDDASIDFISEFYDAYFRYNSIEKAFHSAQTYVDLVKKKYNLKAILSRRAQEIAKDRFLFQVFPTGADSILVDISGAEADIQKLKISRDEFLSLLSRKVRIHKWAFEAPRERAIISVGPYFGLFSWKNANDVVYCQQVMQLRENSEEELCEVWTYLVVTYNDLYVEKYRTANNPYASSMSIWLEKAIKVYNSTYRQFFEKEQVSAILRKNVPEQFKVTKSLFGANLRMIDQKFAQEDFDSTVMYLEATLSAIHDLINALTEILTV